MPQAQVHSRAQQHSPARSHRRRRPKYSGLATSLTHVSLIRRNGSSKRSQKRAARSRKSRAMRVWRGRRMVRMSREGRVRGASCSGRLPTAASDTKVASGRAASRGSRFSLRDGCNIVVAASGGHRAQHSPYRHRIEETQSLPMYASKEKVRYCAHFFLALQLTSTILRGLCQRGSQHRRRLNGREAHAVSSLLVPFPALELCPPHADTSTMLREPGCQAAPEIIIAAPKAIE